MKVYNCTNKRYKLAEYKKEYYLIDMDKEKYCWFFPMFVWLRPIEGIKIKKKSFEKMKDNNQKSYSLGKMIGLSILLQIPIGILVKILSEELIFEISHQIKSIIVVFMTVLFIFLRSMNAKIKQEKMNRENIQSVGENDKVAFKIDQTTLSNYYKNKIKISFGLFYVPLLGSAIIAIYSSFEFFIIYGIVFFSFLYINRSFVFPYGSEFKVVIC